MDRGLQRGQIPVPVPEPDQHARPELRDGVAVARVELRRDQPVQTREIDATDVAGTFHDPRDPKDDVWALGPLPEHRCVPFQHEALSLPGTA